MGEPLESARHRLNITASTIYDSMPLRARNR
jgi:hypothetical protein